MNSKMYRIGFYVLLVINIVLVVIFTLKPKPPIPQKGIKEQISSELDFTEEQKAVFGEMAKNHRDAIHDLEKQERVLVRSFFGQLSLDNPNGNKEALLQEILQLEKDKIMVTYNHFEELKEICDEEQLIRFDKVIERIVPMLINSSGRPMKPDKPPF